MRLLAWTSGVSIAAVFSVGLAWMSTAPSKVTKPEFVPGTQVTIHVGNGTLTATIDDVPRLQRPAASTILAQDLQKLRQMLDNWGSATFKQRFDALDYRARQSVADRGTRG